VPTARRPIREPLTLDCRQKERACLITDQNAQPDSMPSFAYEHCCGFAVIDGAPRVDQCAFGGVVQPELDDDLWRVSSIVES